MSDVVLNPSSYFDRQLARLFGDRFRRMIVGPGASEKTTGSTGTIMDGRPERAFEKEREYGDLYGLAVDGWKRYLSDPRVASAVDQLAEHATSSDERGRKFYPTLDVEEMPQGGRVARGFSIVENATRELRLEAISPQIAKRAMIEGFAYRRNIIDVSTKSIVESREIEGAKEGYFLQKLLDRRTRRLVGFALRDMRYQKTVDVMAPGEVSEFQWNQFMHYGTSLFVSSKLVSDRLDESEESMHAARQERSYTKMAFIYEGVSAEKLKQLRAEHQAEQRARGVGVSTDYFVNRDVKMFDPHNFQLGNINDVEYTEKQLLTAGRVPKGFHAGYGEQINRSVLEKQEEGLIRMLSNVTAMLSYGFKSTLDLQLMLFGIIPNEIPYAMTWVEKRVEGFLDLCRALSIARTDFGLSPQACLQRIGEDPELEIKRNVMWDERMNVGRNAPDLNDPTDPDPMDGQPEDGVVESAIERRIRASRRGRDDVLLLINDARTASRRGWSYR